MRALHILHLEDDPLDAELVAAYLENGGFDCRITRVETRIDFVEALERETFDLILADYSLPMFDGITALNLLRAREQEFPFILLSGALGEDLAIESLKSGATDYVLKQRLERLAPAVRRALREADERRERKRAEEELRNSEERFRLAAEAVNGLIYDWNPDTGYVYRSEGLLPLMGYRPEEAEPTVAWWRAHIHPDDMLVVELADERIREGAEQYEAEYRLRHREGDYRAVWDKGSVVRDASGKPTRIVGSTVDITSYKQAQAAIEDLNTRLQRAVAESHHRIKNNLQVLAALVEMQRMKGGDTVPASALDRLGQHIRSLASLHDLLTSESKGSGGLNSVSLKETLDRLVPLLSDAAGGRRIVVQADEAHLPLKQGSSFTLLVNELVSNAIKHGRGDIEVLLEAQGELVCLTVSDAGPGWPAGFDPKTAGHTGMELIESLGGWDLRGKIEYRNSPAGGASVVVTFPVPELPDPYPTQVVVSAALSLSYAPSKKT